MMQKNRETIYERIAVVMQTQYGLRAARISEQPGGWAALAFRVEGEEATYFLKMYEKKRTSTAKWTANIHLYAPILGWLGRQPSLQGHLPVPVPTQDGNWKHEDEWAVYLLYEYIEGKTIGGDPLTEKQIAQLSHIITTLHLYGESIPFDCAALRETFQVPFVDPLRDVLNQHGLMGSGKACALMEVLQPKRQILNVLMEKVAQLSSALTDKKLDFVLCHTDIHNWNIMQTGNRLLLIDWEGLRVAPREADLMFLVDQPYYDHFIDHYRSCHTTFEMNADIMLFYQIRRKLEDIWEFIEQFLNDEQSTQLAAKTIRSLHHELLDLEKFK